MATFPAVRANAPAAPAATSYWLRPVIVIPLGLLAAIGGWCIGVFFVGLLPLWFYGDEDVPAGFDQPYEAFMRRSPVVAGVTAVLLLVTAGALAPVRRTATRVLCAVATGCAAATPWVWMLVTCALADHWYQLNQ